MKWCQSHWDKLRAEVDRQGLGALVPESGEAAASVLQRAAAGEEGIDAFDPLMGAHLVVNSFIASMLGQRGIIGRGGIIAVYGLDGCAVCKVDEVHQADCRNVNHEKPCTLSIDWCFTNAVEDQKKAWLALGDRQ